MRFHRMRFQILAKVRASLVSRRPLFWALKFRVQIRAWIRVKIPAGDLVSCFIPFMPLKRTYFNWTSLSVPDVSLAGSYYELHCDVSGNVTNYFRWSLAVPRPGACEHLLKSKCHVCSASPNSRKAGFPLSSEFGSQNVNSNQPQNRQI